MTDLMSSEARSELMSRIRSKNTKPEMIVRRALHARGFRYRLHSQALIGRPDIVLPKYHAVIFVHGCFWHRHRDCSLAYTPNSRQNFWENKFDKNVARDRQVRDALEKMGWRVLLVWECAVRAPRTKVEENLEAMLGWLVSGKKYGEVSRGGMEKDQ